MTFKALAVETARYHSRMAVRELKYFHWSEGAKNHRAERDRWIKMAREA